MRCPRAILAATSAVAALAAGVLVSGVAAPLERPLLDGMVRMAARLRPPAPATGVADAAVVALDAASLRAVGAWPWPRSLWGELVGRLDAAGAEAVALDFDFSSPSDPAQDAAFADAIARSGRVVLAAFRQREQNASGVALEFSSRPLPVLARAAAGVGSVMVHVDPDGVVRTAPERTEIHGEDMPGLAHRALALAAGAAPAAGDAPLRLDYRRLAHRLPVVSAEDVLAGRFDPRELAGRAVYVGATALEFQDLWPTPVDPALPGVFIQALAHRTLAARGALEPTLALASPATQLGLALVLSLAAAALGAAGGARRALGLLGLAVGVLGAVVVGALAGWLWPPLVPFGVLALHYGIGLETVRRRIGLALSRRDSSLAALQRVGDTSSRGAGEDGLRFGLQLLGDVVGARAVALHRAGPDGALHGEVLEWRGAGAGSVGDPSAVARAAAGTRLVQGALPSGEPGTLVYAPLHVAGTLEGVLVVERSGGEPLGELELRTVATVGSQLALAARNVRLVADLRATFTSSIEAIASAVEARDGYTQMHCRRLAILSGAMARRLGLPEAEVEAIELGALLHDVGKIGIRDEVLLKPGRLTRREQEVMQQHVEIGHHIIRPIGGLLDTARACVRHHHERWDGQGYPDGLAGEEIPLGARVVAIADVYDALSTVRPYKPAYPPAMVREILLKERGHQLDPELVELFLRLLDEEGELLLAGFELEEAR